jgi:hypothetical protein
MTRLELERAADVTLRAIFAGFERRYQTGGAIKRALCGRCPFPRHTPTEFMVWRARCRAWTVAYRANVGAEPLPTRRMRRYQTRHPEAMHAA